MFEKVLIANRGEIAVRIIRALRELQIRSVAVYSEADRRALHVQMADEAVPVGPAASTESYLRIDKLIDAALLTGAEAIHPGYGFLSENADFAQACREAGIIFIGPSPESIRALGSKIEARRLAVRAGVPVVPGTESPLASEAEALARAGEIGFPVLLKAAAGGGGKGMRLVTAEVDLAAAFRDASSEAERAFRSPELFMERALIRPRHIEVQLLGDQHGHMIHLGERECSIQRRHQKVIEECPSPFVAAHPDLREKLGAAALKAAQAAGYYNAGTAEFLVDSGGGFYFLEMNTRLQVEHPVTELVTATDLVHWQLRIAAGEKLTLQQSEIAWRGAAIECRIYAEDPEQFLPSPGTIQQLSMPSGPGIRVDSGVYAGWTVPMDYDPLLAKLTVWAGSRDAAIARLRRALDETHLSGITTNLALFRGIADDEAFRSGALHTGFLGEYFDRRSPRESPPELAALAALVAAIHENSLRKETPATAPVNESRWLLGRDGLMR